jgi:16S rRNA (cytosine967-C5)-methyltransferase
MADKARLLAFEAIDDVLRQGKYSNLALKKSQNILDSRDKKFCTVLFYGTIEKLLTIDYILSKYIKKAPKPVIKNILRMGVYQIYFMDSIPDHAACTESAELAKKLGKRGAVSFINGVLRNVARGEKDFKIPDNIEKIKRLSIEYSFPEWIIRKWIKEIGKEVTFELISYTKKNYSTIYPNSLKGVSSDKLIEKLEENSISFEKSKFVKDTYHTYGDIINTSLFRNGEIAIQGEGSYLASKVAVENHPKTVLDVCAAPGGKTVTMAHLNKDADYTACDIRQNRLDITKKQFERFGVNATIRLLDASKPFDDIGPFDTVLCDVPCSALGTVFTHPDVRYNKSPEIIKEIVNVQKKIINNASKHVSTNGYLIYSTCTISKVENHDIVDNFLKNNSNFNAVFPETFHGIIKKDRFDGCGVQLLPHKDNTAGFYISCLKRVK